LNKEQQKYRTFLKGIGRIDPSLRRFILERVGQDGKIFKRLMHGIQLQYPEQYTKLIQAADTAHLFPKKMLEKRKGEPCSIKRFREDLWKICEGIENIYSCKQGFAGTEAPRTYTVYLFNEKKVTGDVDKDMVARANDIAYAYHGKRKWTFGHDNRIFSCLMTPSGAQRMAKDSRIYKVVEEPLATILYGEYAPYPAYTPGTDNIDWGVSQINTSFAWAKGIKGAGVKVCIIDTGIEATHVDLIDRYVGGHNFVAGDDKPWDDHGHGTHCAAIACASEGGVGYTGVAPEADVYACKVLNSKGSGSFSDIAAGIDWGRVNEMDVLSLSLGASDYACQGATMDAINNAWAAGLLVVVAAGNDGHLESCDDNDCVNFPGNCSASMCVGAIEMNEYCSEFSSRGPELEFAAPGEGITAAKPEGYNMYGADDTDHLVGTSWLWANGTSMACPHVAGACALVKCWFPDATNVQIRQWLRDNAKDL
jgi:subtilisin family serine protease